MTTDAVSSPVIASSFDGRRFQFTGGAESILDVGAFVTLDVVGGAMHIGQIELLEVADGQQWGSGSILGTFHGSTGLNPRASFAFGEAGVATADAAVIHATQKSVGASVRVGTLLGDADVPAYLLPHRFNRHTFWCGQSGSGKTYALGVLLEQLLIETALPMVIFDPNSDFVRLGELQGSGTPEQREALGSRNVRVLRPHTNSDPAVADAADESGLYARFTSLSLRATAAVLKLDPVVDRAEYNALLHLNVLVGAGTQNDILRILQASDDPTTLQLAQRLENLGIIDWNVWAGHHTDVTEVLDTRPDATVVDLGGFAHPDEPLVVALAVLEDLWNKREQRRPILIVIDEAHNLCSPDGDSPLQRAVRDRIIQIAAEGRKFGLWLLLSTQRPSKVHPGIISQCDNLALMKMSSPQDLIELGALFGYVPTSLLERSPRFRQGEVLFAGGFVPAPTMVRMGERLTYEGGSDVGVPTR